MYTMFYEYILYYGVCFLYGIILASLVFFVFLISLWIGLKNSKGFIWAAIACMFIFAIPYATYTNAQKEVEPYRISFMRNFTPSLYKKEICPQTAFAYLIEHSITYNVALCYPEETKLRVKADAWYKKRWGSLMQECLENANPIFKHRCESAAKEYFRGMMENDLKHVTFEQMVAAGEKRFSFYSASAREGMRY